MQKENKYMTRKGLSVKRSPCSNDGAMVEDVDDSDDEIEKDNVDEIEDEDDSPYEDDVYDKELEEELAAEEAKAERKKKKNEARLVNKTINYVDGDVMTRRIAEYYKTSVMSNDLVEDIRKIANRLCTSMKFAGYTYRDEMEADAFLKSYKAIHSKKFDLTKGFSPFSYITMICYRACLLRIRIEKAEHSKIEAYREEHYDRMKVDSFNGEDDYSGAEENY